MTVLLVVLPIAAAAAADLAGPARVVDGDSLAVAGRAVRLYGVDAPEGGQPCERDGGEWLAGREATAWLKARIEGRAVVCVAEDTDRYGRTVATCRVDGADVGGDLVAAGWAFAYWRYSTRYVAAEAAARAAGRGIWAGRCDPPWAWRKGK